MTVSAALICHVHEFVIAHALLPTGDEHGHLIHSLNAYRYLCESVGWSKLRVLADQAPSDYYPPFLHTVAASLFAITGNTHHKMGELAVIPFLVVLMGSTWYLARRAFGPGAALVAAFLAATSPVVLFSAPALYQDVPLMAMVLANLALIQASRNFRRPGYAVGAGVVLGLGLLTKQSCWAYVVPAWLMAAWGFPWRRTRGFATRAGLVVIALVLPAIIGAVFFKMFGREMTLSGYAEMWLALAGWLMIVTFVVPWLAAPRSRHGRRAERRRLAAFAAAVVAACGIAAYWLAADILPLQTEMRSSSGDSHMLLTRLTQVAQLYPPPWGDCLARSYMYGLHLIHVLNPVPVAVCALCVLVVVLVRPRRWRRVVPVAMCLLFSFAFYTLVFPLYRNGYMYPIVGFMIVLAAGVARARWLLAVPLVALLLATGGLQAACSRGLALPQPMWKWTARSKEPLVLDEWAPSPRYLFIRSPDPTKTDLDEFFADLAANPQELLPVLCVVPDCMDGGLSYYAAASGMKDSVYVAWPRRPGRATVASSTLTGASVVREAEVQGLSFKSVLVFRPCVIAADGSIEVRSPWLQWSTSALGHFEYLRKYDIPNSHRHDPDAQEFLLYRVRQAGPSGQ